MNIDRLDFEAKITQYIQCFNALMESCHNAAEYIFLPNIEHVSQVQQLIQDMRHVFVLQHSLSIADLQYLYKLSDEAKVQLQFAEPWLYTCHLPLILQRLGEVKLLQWRLEKSEAASFSTLQLDEFLSLLAIAANAEVKRVEQHKTISLNNGFEHCSLQISFANIVLAQISQLQAGFSDSCQVYIVGANAVAYIDFVQEQVQLKLEGGKTESLKFCKESAIQQELAAFFQAVKEGKTPRFSLRQMILKQQILQQLNA
ncbi:MAG: hypothetical protein ACRC9X_02645 [Bacteroidales bacterium]